MASKNDLSAYKKQQSPSTESQNILQSVPTTNKVMGRPKVEEPRTFKVTVCFTEREGELLKDKAGIAPMSAMVIKKLHETDLFK